MTHAPHLPTLLTGSWEPMFLKFMFKNALKPEVRPFTYGFLFTWFSINYLSCSGSAEARAASTYCNPPKHH